MIQVGIVGPDGHRYGKDCYKKLREFGFTYVDFGLGETDSIYYSGTQAECDAAILEQKKLAEEAGIMIGQVHGPWRWPPLDITVKERAERMEKMKHSIRATALLGCPNWVIHPIMPFGWQERRHFPGHEQDTWEINREFMGELLETAKEYDVTICLENMPMPDFSIGSVEEILCFVKEMNDEKFKICLDTGHAAVYPGQGVGDAVRLLKDEIRVLHVHDNNGRDDCHWLPYRGVIDWADFGKALKEINYQGAFCYETVPTGKLPEPIYEDACRLLVKIANDIMKSD